MFNFLHFRTTSLQTDNPSFPQTLVTASSDQILNLKLRPSEPDLKYWKILSGLFLDNEIGVPDSDDLTLEQMITRMRPPLLTREEQDEIQEAAEGDDEWEDVSEDEEDGDVLDLGAQGQIDIDDISLGGDTESSPIEEKPMVIPARTTSLPARIEEGENSRPGVPQEPADTETGPRASNLTGGDYDEDDGLYIPFEVWSLLRKSSILRRRADNATPAFHCIDDHEFGRYYFKASDGVFAVDSRPEVWISGILCQTTHLGLVRHLTKWGMQGNVSSPSLWRTSSD